MEASFPSFQFLTEVWGNSIIFSSAGGCSVPENQGNAFAKTPGNGFPIGQVIQFACRPGIWALSRI